MTTGKEGWDHWPAHSLRASWQDLPEFCHLKWKGLSRCSSLYYYPGNASLLPHMMLREIGAEFELRLVDRGQNAQKSPDYLKLNPSGRIPVLIDGDLVLFETAAVALHLGRQVPGGQAWLPPLELRSGPTSTSG